MNSCLYFISVFIIYFSSYNLNAQGFENSDLQNYSFENQKNSFVNEIKKNLSTNIGFGFNQHSFSSVSFILNNVNIGNASGDIFSSNKKIVSLEIGIYYKINNNFNIGLETQDSFFGSTLRRNLFAVNFSNVKFFNFKKTYIIPGLRVGSLRKRVEFENLVTTNINIGGFNFDSSSLFFYDNNAFSFGPFFKFPVLRNKSFDIFASSSFNFNFFIKEKIFIRENKTFFYRSAKIENYSNNIFSYDMKNRNNFSSDFSFSIGFFFKN